jgi:hypothetical protein
LSTQNPLIDFVTTPDNRQTYDVMPQHSCGSGFVVAGRLGIEVAENMEITFRIKLYFINLFKLIKHI